MIGTAAAILISAVVGVGSSIFAANAKTDAANKGIAASKTALDKKLALIDKQNTQARADSAPWRQAGQAALEKLTAGIADGSFNPANFNFTADPGYQYRLDQGQQAVARSAAAKGNLLSGSTAEALQRDAQGFASNEYGRAYARNANSVGRNFNTLASVAGVGQRAVESLTATGRYGTGASVNALGVNTNSQQLGYNQIGNAWGNAFQNIGSSINTGLENNLLYNALGAP